MLGHSFANYFISLLALLGFALAAEVYRKDDRAPAAVKRDGGLNSYNPHGDGSVIEHVKNTLGKDDPWVSTTTDYNIAKKGAQAPHDIYVYYIDTSGLDAVDTIQAFKDANEEHPHPGEKEIAVKGSIPWENIIQWDTVRRNKVVATTTRQEYDNQRGGRKARSFAA
ncbi:ADP-ribosylation [Daldinia eschscholtzii]|nr:ADP-ribosylation [Daldinia eschscholtzii]